MTRPAVAPERPRTPAFLRPGDIASYQRWISEVGIDPVVDRARMGTLLMRLQLAASQRDAAYGRVSQALREGTITYADGRTEPINACSENHLPCRPDDEPSVQVEGVTDLVAMGWKQA